jgi:ferredoxin-nitrite reductase
MCRLRMPGGILDAHQLRGLADVAERLGGGYADITTRANLQIREIAATNAPALLMAVQELGLTSRGAGADNIRNITGSPTAGIDPQELFDTRPLCRELHHLILNHRELYGLPRKFNIAFDGGGRVPVLEDTNDIGFSAVRVEAATPEVAAGIYFRMGLGGITGHGDFAADTGVLLTPEECIPVAVAALRVFIENGDRTDRKKARLKYLLDRWGLTKFLEETEKQLGKPLRRFPLERCAKRPVQLKDGHIGIHEQRQAGLRYLGVAVPVGRLAAAQMRAVADIARRFGSGTIRLTVWQNLILSDIPETEVAEAIRALEAAGLGCAPTGFAGSLVACTGNVGCKFALSDTKGDALAIARHLEQHIALDQPLNIHLTGCPHSCAQHYVGDIGLLATKIGEDMIEGYHVLVGGGAGADRALARELYRDVPAGDAPQLLKRVLRAWMAERRDAAETFQAFTTRHDPETLRRLVEEHAAGRAKAA